MTGRYAKPVVVPYTGSGIINIDYAPSVDFWLHSITVHLSAVPSTSESITIKVNATDGSAYDTLLVTHNFANASDQDLYWQPESGALLCELGDGIDIDFANTDAATYGVRIVVSYT